MDWAGVSTSFNDSTDIVQLKKHDIRCELRGVEFYVESKFDSMQSKTGNLAVEFHNPQTDKPSGIMATASDLWAIVLKDPTAVWICRTQDLKRYFSETKPLKEILRGGDGNASLRIYKSDDLLNAVFVRIDEEPPWEVLSILTSLLSEKFKNGRPTSLANSLQNKLGKKGNAMGYFHSTC